MFHKKSAIASFIFGLTLLLCICSCGRKTETMQVVAIDMRYVSKPGETVAFSETHSVSSLPPSVLAQFAGGLANPSGKFRESDRSDASLPARRLMVAGISDRYVIVHFQKGGISTFYATALFARSTNDTKLFWVSSSDSASDLHGVKSALESGRLTNELGTLAW